MGPHGGSFIFIIRRVLVCLCATSYTVVCERFITWEMIAMKPTISMIFPRPNARRAVIRTLRCGCCGTEGLTVDRWGQNALAGRHEYIRRRHLAALNVSPRLPQRQISPLWICWPFVVPSRHTYSVGVFTEYHNHFVRVPTKMIIWNFGPGDLSGTWEGVKVLDFIAFSLSCLAIQFPVVMETEFATRRRLEPACVPIRTGFRYGEEFGRFGSVRWGVWGSFVCLPSTCCAFPRKIGKPAT